VAVGWVIQEALSRRRELERVPLAAVTRGCDGIDQLLAAGIAHAEADARDQMMAAITTLANELDWLKRCAVTVDCNADSLLKDQVDDYFDLKAELTGQEEPDVSPPRIRSRAMPTATLSCSGCFATGSWEDPSKLGKL
jgi:hypothetical protein